MLCACNKETETGTPEEIKVENSEEAVNLVEVSFTATSDFTKTVLNADRSVSFSANDRISVFANGNNYEFTTTAGGDEATFTGSMSDADAAASAFYALFPYSASATIEGEEIQNIVLAKTSNAVVNGYAPQQAVFVAKTTGSSFVFKPVCALLKITVPDGVDDLKEVDVFNRQSELAGALTGTFKVDMSGASPAVTVTATSADPHTVIINTGSSFSPGVYYIPVLPAHLAKGVDMKMTFSGSYVARVATGAEITLESGLVYNLGTIKKSKEHVYSSFENGFSVSGEYYGNDGISIINNPLQNGNNPSAKVMRLDMHNRSAGSSTSGFISFDISDIKFPASNADKTFIKCLKTLKIKMYWGEINNSDPDLRYYPRMLWNKSGTAYRPARLNGVTITDQASFDAAYRANDWNELEWDYDQFGKTSFYDLTGVQIRNFVNWDNGGLTTGAGYNLIVHWDDVAFVVYK